MTKAEFKKVLKGRTIYVTVSGSETDVRISHLDALYLFERMEGDVAWWNRGKDMFLEARAQERFGETGYMGTLKD